MTYRMNLKPLIVIYNILFLFCRIKQSKYLSLRVKSMIFSDMKQITIFSADFPGSPNIKLYTNQSSGSHLDISEETEWWTDMKLIVAFRFLRKRIQ